MLRAGNFSGVVYGLSNGVREFDRWCIVVIRLKAPAAVSAAVSFIADGSSRARHRVS